VGEASSPARIPVGNTPSLNLGRVAETGAPMVSIGGAGTFAVPVLLPPLLAADVALVLAFRQAPPVAYIAGTMGALIGADLLRCQRPGTTWAISDSPPARPRRKLSGARCRIAFATGLESRLVPGGAGRVCPGGAGVVYLGSAREFSRRSLVR
jgi:hypothetical protein